MNRALLPSATVLKTPSCARARAALVVAVVLVGGLGACTSDSGSDRVVEATAETTGPVEAPSPENFTGPVDDFYVVPDPLPAGPAGSLIRTQAIDRDEATVTVRVMYRSVDVSGAARAVTGIVTYPRRVAPSEGWPVVASAHGTTGLAPACAPSRGGEPAPAFGLENVVRVATDYIGLGPVGERHAYLSGPSEAHSVIDSVRAARGLVEAHASETWAAIGHSQGGHAALWTNELGASYAPELDFRGSVVVAPAAVLPRTFGPKDQIVPRTVGIMALYGVASVDDRLDPDDYVSDLVAQRAAVLDSGCMDEIIEQLASIFDEDFYLKNPIETEPARTVLAENDPGHVAVDAPLLLVYGTADTWVVPDRVHALFDQLCAAGQVTDLVRIDGADHGTVLSQRVQVFTDWLSARLEPDPSPGADVCPDGWR